MASEPCDKHLELLSRTASNAYFAQKVSAPAIDPSKRFLEGAVCHGCLYVAEPSCERFNNYLDRALVVPTMGNPVELAFFGEP